MGLLHIYTGNGKGKTTAALGLALRAAGSGMKVCFVQFMKGGETGELNSLKLIPSVTVMRPEKSFGFFSSLSETEKNELSSIHMNLLRSSLSGDYDLVVLDEFNIAYHYELLNKKEAFSLVTSALKTSEVVLTGRCPAPEFMSAADYISEIAEVKHPYSRGIEARKGIEY